jgi:WG containing repeat
MADKAEIQRLQQSRGSALIRSEVDSSLVTRGRRAAAALLSSRNEPLCLAAVVLNGAWGFIDQTGKFVIPLAYAWVGCFSEGRACCSTSADGDAHPVFISWRFDHGMTAADGERFLFRYGQQPGVLPNNSLGYMNPAGEIMVPPRFVCAEPFKDGIARVATKEKSGTGFIDCEGRAIGSLEFDGAANFQEGYAVVMVGDRFGAITLQGEYAVPPKYDYVWDFTEGFARVLVGEKVGFVNGRGDIAIDPIFDAADRFSDGLAAVCIGRDWGYIDTAGTVVIKPQFWEAGRFRNGKAEVEDWDAQKLFWINTAGNITTPIALEEDESGELEEGPFRVQEDDLWGFQDSSRAFVVKPSFRKAGKFSNHLARVMNQQGLWGYIDRDGQARIPFGFNDARDFLIVDAANVADR